MDYTSELTRTDRLVLGQRDTDGGVRIGYAAGPQLASQIEALRDAGCVQVFAEIVPSRARARPEFARALTLCGTAGLAAPDRDITLTVLELNHAARTSAELIELALRLRRAETRLELLGGRFAGVHGPDSTLFTVLTALGRLDHDHRHEQYLEGQREAAAQGHTGGRPKVIDDDMLAFAVGLRDEGVPVPDIAARLTIRTGANAGQSPSVASVYRALARAGSAPSFPRQGPQP
ncbi:MAG: recombinase family protein [Streptosporangiaceae bacterium]